MPFLELAKILNNGDRCRFCIQDKFDCDCNCTQNTAKWLDQTREYSCPGEI